MALFEAQDVCKHFRHRAAVVRAIDGVSLTIEQGSLSVLTGPSGSGKTTLLALLGTLERPTHGRVLFDGADLATFSGAELARIRRRIGFVFQNFALIPQLPVWENITYPLIPCGVRRSARRSRARALLERFGLAEKFEEPPERLSGGEQQRVAIARALAGHPAVLLADEPTSNLDPSSAKWITDVLRESHLAGETVVVASHDPSVLSQATHVYELELGKLKQHCT